MRAPENRFRQADDRTRLHRLALLSIVLVVAVAGVRPSGSFQAIAIDEDPGYSVFDADGTPTALNPAHRLRVRFHGAGVAVEPLDRTSVNRGLDVALLAIGRGEPAPPLEPIGITLEGNQVHYAFASRLSATFENAERGLGIVVSVPESFAFSGASESLRIELALTGAIRTTVAPDGASAEATLEDHALLRLDQIRATDAAGRQLATRIEAGRSLALVVDDTGAEYPLSAEIVLGSPELARIDDPSGPIRPAVVPTNDKCAGAEILDLDTTVFGNSAEAIDDYRSTGNASCYSGIGQATSTAAFLGVGRDVVYSFTAPDAGAYSFRAAAYGGFDLMLYLTTACPVTPPAAIVSCSAGANRTTVRDEEIFCRSMAAGEQTYLIVDDRTFQGGGPFRLEVTRCRRESEPNAGTGTATPALCGIEGAFSVGSPFSDIDFFSLGTWSAGRRVFALADAVAANNFDADMRVTTAADTLEYDDADADTPFGPTSATCAGTILPGGPAFLRLNSKSTTIFEPYRLYATVQPPSSLATPESEPNDSLGLADASVADYFSGTLASAADVDLFSFQANEGEVLFLGLDGDPLRDNTPINPALALLDSTGAVLLAVNDTSAFSTTTPGTASLAALTPTSPGEGLAWRATYSGTHYARVSGAAAGDWLLSITRDCVAATPTDLEVTKSAAATVGTGQNLVYDIRVHNAGANDATIVELNDAIPAATTFRSITAPAGWTCSTPAVGGTGTVSCTTPVLSAGVEAVFSLVVRVDWCAGNGTIVLNEAEATSLTAEADPGDNTDSVSTTVIDPDVCDDENACTQADVCQAGVCVGTNPVLCTALDSCHLEGTCDTTTGVCSNPIQPNGTTCDDGDGCTQTDTCQGGACSGANPVVCVASDQCHLAGICAPATGLCSDPQKPNGSACADGNACTQSDTCQAGACAGANPVLCTALDACHDVGVCAPATGLCSNPPKPDGTACDDGSLCTQSDSCQVGACVGANPVSCAAVCTAGVDCPSAYKYSHDPESYLDETHTAPYDQYFQGQLGDGVRGGNDWDADLGSGASYEWVGWSDDDPAVTFEFPSARSFDAITVGLNHTPSVLIFEPDEIHVAFSLDGSVFGPAVVFRQSDATLPTIPADTRADVTLAFSTQVGRYVRITFVNAGMWTFVDEIAFGAPDQCHLPGTCDPGTGICSHPTRPDGTACSDGDLCTQSDTCQSGACQGASPVVCSAQDDCHQVGTCDPGTGVCSNPVQADGSACNDGNLCTTTDTCSTGVCQGTNPVVCTILDQCHVLGACDPGTGVCSNPAKPDGTACDDTDACSQTDTCQAGSCAGTNPVVCTASDQCHLAGICDPGSGLCSDPQKPDGAACGDGDACTQTDTCQGGACAGANPVVCTALDDCHQVGVCAPATGLCSNPLEPDGTACSDESQCTQTDTCVAGDCVGANPVSCATTCTVGVDCPTAYKFSHAPGAGAHAYFDEPHNVAANGAANDNTGFDELYAGQLTDGQRGADFWDADLGSGPGYEWVGWDFNDPSLTFEFPSVRSFDALTIGLNHTPSVLIFEPEEVHLEFSLDGTLFGPAVVFQQSDATLPAIPPDTRADVTLAFPTKLARYVRITFVNAGKWTFVDEVAFGAPDQCHLPGTCDPGTGLCSHPAQPDGTSCSDGDLCTQSDTCQSGSCQGASPVVCVAQDDCHQVGACAPETGVCSNPLEPDTTSCDDADACTQTDTCQSGACQGANPVVCPAPDTCHLPGTCAPATGVCSNPEKANGSACDDEAYCSVGETCTAGVCGGSAPRVCTDPVPCNVGTCDEGLDVCTFLLVNAGDPDGDGVPACIDTCTDRINGGPAPGCVIPPAGLVAWWPLDETDGSSSEDLAGDHDGTQVDSPTPIAAVVNGGLSFDGVDDYVEAPDDPDLDFGTGDFSVDAWIRTLSPSTDPELILDDRREQSVGGPQGWALFAFDGRLWFQLSSGGAASNYDSGIAIDDGQWHHVAVTVDRDDPAGGKFYVDYVAPLPAIVTFDPTARGGTLDNDAPLRLGRRSDSADPGFYAGDMDEVELFRGVALAATDVEALATAGAAGKCKPGQEDLDGDAIGDACDPDDDGDAVTDASDCAPLDSTAWAVPEEITLVRVTPVAPGSVEVEWSAGNGATTIVYDLVTGPLSALPVGAGGGASETGTCGETDTTATIAADPAVGTGSWIIVRARNQCGAGSYGVDRDNGVAPFPLHTPRATATCP